MDIQEDLQRALEALESQRSTLGDAAVDAALEGVRRKMASMAPSGQPPDGERRIITVMFADLSGFTAISERTDPETVRALVGACFDTLVPVVKKYGGAIDKFIGDEIMALYGAPEAHEDDPERALRAALEMNAALAAFNRRQGSRLGMHFGINTGLVVAGSVGGRRLSDYSVMGDTVNLAARLAEAANDGEILVGEATYQLTARIFDFERLPPLKMKGKERPVQAYALCGLKAVPGPRRGLEGHGLSSPLVGRDVEYAVLMGCVERLRRGEGGIVGIFGEAGFGKSRLVMEVRKSTEGRPDAQVQWLEGHSISFGESTGYGAFRRILHRLAGIDGEDAEEDAWKKLEASIAALFPDKLIEFLPAFGVLLHLALPDEYEASIRHFDGKAMGRRIFLAARRLIERLARRSPLVLVFDDLHWMDESSRELLEHILPLISRVPLLICCTARPMAEGSVMRFRHLAANEYPEAFTEIRLHPLHAEESGRLVRNLLSDESLPLRLREIILGTAEGNPFFLEEILRTLIATGLIVREDAHDQTRSRWMVTMDIDRIAIPDTIQGVLMARIDHLDPEAKEILKTAAVIGRSFPYRLLQSVVGIDGRLDQRLGELQRAELVRKKDSLPELEYEFTHTLCQEAAYRNVLIEKRKELHGRVAAGIESLYADRIESRYGLLAFHYTRAELWNRAQEYLLKAGDQAGRLSADAEALANYREAVDGYARAFGNRWDPFERAVLERKIGQALYHRGEHEKSREYLLRALDLLGYSFPKTDRGIIFAILLELLIQIGHRISAPFLRGTSEKTVSRRFNEAVGNLVFICTMFSASHPLLAVLAAIQFLNLAERQGSLEHQILGNAGFGYFCVSLGLKRATCHYTNKAVLAASGSRDPTAVAYAHYCRATYQYLRGDWTAARESFRSASAAFRETGNLWLNTACTVVPASIRRLCGDSAGILSELRELLPVVRDSGDTMALAVVLDGLAHILHYTGPLSEALECSLETVRLTRSISDIVYTADHSGELGFIYIRMGKLDEAISILEEAVGSIKRNRVSSHNSTQPLDALALAYITAMERAPSEGRRVWRPKTRRACRDALRQGRVDRAGLACALRFRARYEWLIGRRRAARGFWRKGLAEAEKLGAVYETGMIRLEMGERLHNADLLMKAERILDSAGAALDGDLARKALADMEQSSESG